MDLREALADLAHDQWAGWMDYLFECSKDNADGSVTIPSGLVKRWKRQCNTIYEDLSEEEKDSDRKESDKMIKIFENKFGPWVTEGRGNTLKVPYHERNYIREIGQKLFAKQYDR